MSDRERDVTGSEGEDGTKDEEVGMEEEEDGTDEEEADAENGEMKTTESKDEQGEEDASELHTEMLGDDESLAGTKKKKSVDPGIIYLGHIPPRLRPRHIRNMLSIHGEVGRIFLQAEGKQLLPRGRLFWNLN